MGLFLVAGSIGVWVCDDDEFSFNLRAAFFVCVVLKWRSRVGVAFVITIATRKATNEK